MPIEDKIYDFILKHKLLSPGDSVLIGVSGGMDSMSLLHILYRLQHRLGIQLIVGHVNHNLHKKALSHQRFVEIECSRLNIKFFAKNVHIEVSPQKSSLEDLARDKRFEALFGISKKNHIHKIVLAHHQDDLAETLMMRILRGTGLQGLRGILPCKEFKEGMLIRPLLEITRQEIEQYVKEHNIPYRQDPTNKQTKFLRNQIRLQLIPYLKHEYNPNITQILAQLAQRSGKDYDFLYKCAEEKFNTISQVNKNGGVRLRQTGYHKLHPALRAMIIRLSIKQLRGQTKQFSSVHIDIIDRAIMIKSRGQLTQLPQKISLRIKNGFIYLT
jgi:tRNA(Ile)-lysidine synthase